LPEAGRRAKQAFSKPRTFFVGPIHKANSHRRLAMVLRVDAAENFHTRENIQATIEPAAVRHGIHVAADEQTFFRSPRKVVQRFPAASVLNFHGSSSSFFFSHARVWVHIGVKATR